MARIGNFDVTLNKQGWFDIDSADPLNGWFDDTAVGATGASTINVQPPGIPSASVQVLPKVIQIVQAPGVPSSGTSAPAMVAVLVEPPGIPSDEVQAPAQAAFVIKPAAVPSAEIVAPADVAARVQPPGIPAADVVAPAQASKEAAPASHGGWPPTPTTTRARERQPPWSYEQDWLRYFAEAPPLPPIPPQNDNARPWAQPQPWWPRETEPKLSDTNPLTHNVGLLDTYGPMDDLPEADFLVAGNVETGVPWKKILVGVGVGVAVGYFAAQMGKKPGRKSGARARRK